MGCSFTNPNVASFCGVRGSYKLKSQVFKCKLRWWTTNFKKYFKASVSYIVLIHHNYTSLLPFFLSFTQNFSRTDRLLRHRRMCVVGIPKEENTSCCEGRPYSQEPSQQSWSPLQSNNGSSRLAVWRLSKASVQLCVSGVDSSQLHLQLQRLLSASDCSWRLLFNAVMFSYFFF